MGDRYLTDLAHVLRQGGLDVVELDGWTTRARSSGGYGGGDPRVVMVHHTASPPSASGESDAWYCATGDEDAPLSNLCLDRAGCWWVLAAGATNTNGKGGPLGSVAKDCMNTAAIGVEANGGYGESWPPAQTVAYEVGVAALCDAYGIAEIWGHAEWAPDRKIDPAGPSPWAAGNVTWDMNAFRDSVADCRNGEDDDMALSDDDVDRIADAVWSKMIDTTGSAAGVDQQPARYWLQRGSLIVAQYLGSFSGRPPEESRPSMLKQIHDNTR